jgi:hypothetical protein
MQLHTRENEEWKALNLSVTQNEPELRTIKTTFGCNTRRRYRIRLDCKGPKVTIREAITVYSTPASGPQGRR